MKCMVVVLAVASLCLAEPEADPLHFYAPYSHYPYFYRPYAASGYAGPLPGHSYQAVHRLHKREAEADAEADPQFLLAGSPLVNQGAVSGPLTPAVGDLVATPNGFRSIALEGFSEDLNQDGFVDPVVPAVAAPLVAAPAPLFHTAPAPIFQAAQVAPVVHAAPAPLAPLAAPVAPLLPAAPFVPAPLPVAHAAFHVPEVKTVVETPAEVTQAVVAHPFFHHAPLVHTAPLVHHVAPVVHTAPVPLAHSVHHEVKPFVDLGRKKREADADADAEAEAEANADPYYYSSVAGHGQAYSTFVDDHPVAVAAPVAPLVHAYSHPFGYNYGLPYGYHYGLPYNYAPAPLVYNTAPLVAPAPLPVKPVTYTHLGAHPIAPTTVLEPAL